MYLYYLIAIMVIVIDQFTKMLVIKYMEVFEQIPLIENFFSLTSHRNSGAAWGILAGQMGFFYIVTGIVVVGIIFYMEKYAREDKLLAISLSLILGGALGNFIDRLFYKEVVDFLDFIIFGYDFPIFNVADSALFVGVVLIIIATFIDEKKKEKL